jgi:hypothetical protein
MNETQHNTIISIRGEETKRKENNLLDKVATPLGHLATLTAALVKHQRLHSQTIWDIIIGYPR